MIRINKATKMPGLLTAGRTYSLIINNDKLYLIHTGAFADFDRLVTTVNQKDLASMAAAKITDKIISGGNDKKLIEIEECEKTIDENNLDATLSASKHSKAVAINALTNINFDDKNYKLSFKSPVGGYKFYFSTKSDRDKLTDFVNTLMA